MPIRRGPSKSDFLFTAVIYAIAALLVFASAWGWAVIVLVAWVIAFGSRRD